MYAEAAGKGAAGADNGAEGAGVGADGVDIARVCCVARAASCFLNASCAGEGRDDVYFGFGGAPGTKGVAARAAAAAA